MKEMLIDFLLGFFVGAVLISVLVIKNLKWLAQFYMAKQVENALTQQNEQIKTNSDDDTVLPSNGNPPPPPKP